MDQCVANEPLYRWVFREAAGQRWEAVKKIDTSIEAEVRSSFRDDIN